MRSIVISFVLAATLAACDTTRSISDADRAALEQHRTLWEQRDFHSYEFDYSEAQLSTNYNVHITVENDSIADVVDIATGDPPAVPRNWPTIDALFSEAELAVQEDDISVSLEYNDDLGYMTLFSLSSNNPGGSFLARISNLHPLS